MHLDHVKPWSKGDLSLLASCGHAPRFECMRVALLRPRESQQKPRPAFHRIAGTCGTRVVSSEGLGPTPFLSEEVNFSPSLEAPGNSIAKPLHDINIITHCRTIHRAISTHDCPLYSRLAEYHTPSKLTYPEYYSSSDDCLGFGCGI